jgi:excisionase family DNA binding protein
VAMAKKETEKDYLLTGEVAELLAVSKNTVVKWANEEKIPCIITLGGHRRYPKMEIEALRERLIKPVDE